MANVNRVSRRSLHHYIPSAGLLMFLGIGLAYGAAKVVDEIGPTPELPAPSPSASAVNFSTVIGWPQGQAPNAPSLVTVKI